MTKVFFLIFSISIISCSTTRENSRIPSANNVRYGVSDSETIILQDGVNSKRMVIYDIYFSLESIIPDSIIKSIKKLTFSYKGYVVNSGKNRIQIRIPSNNSKGIIKDIEDLADVKDKNISGQDVTEEYADLEIKLDNIEKARKRYLELLAKAENVEAALKVEKELERLQREHDLLKGREKRLSHLAQFVTIDIFVEKSITPGPLGYIFIGLYKAVKWLFIW